MRTLDHKALMLRMKRSYYLGTLALIRLLIILHPLESKELHINSPCWAERRA